MVLWYHSGTVVPFRYRGTIHVPFRYRGSIQVLWFHSGTVVPFRYRGSIQVLWYHSGSVVPFRIYYIYIYTGYQGCAIIESNRILGIILKSNQNSSNGLPGTLTIESNVSNPRIKYITGFMYFLRTL